MPKQEKVSARGLLSEYANQELQNNEKTAWKRVVKEKDETTLCKYDFKVFTILEYA